MWRLAPSAAPAVARSAIRPANYLLLTKVRLHSTATAAQSTYSAAAAAASTAATSSAAAPAASAAAADSAWRRSHAAQYTPLNSLQRGLLFVGSSLLSVLDPHRGDLVASVGELAEGARNYRQLAQLRATMATTEEGRWLLQHKPRFDSHSGVDVERFGRELPPASLGAQYAKFMKDRGYTPDARAHVRFIADAELAYIVQRYRDIHDLLHVLTGMPTNVLGELGQKYFEALHFRLAMPRLSAKVAPTFTLSKQHRQHYETVVKPWAEQLQCNLNVQHLIAIRYESYLAQPLQQLRKQWGFIDPPPMPNNGVL